jgi:hypothetical protein
VPSNPLQQEALCIVAEGSRRGLAIGLVGGLAVPYRCSVATAHAGLRREYDWALHTLVSDRLVHVKERLAAYKLDPSRSATVIERVEEFGHAPSTSRTRRWKLRAAVGRRKSWYTLPEEEVCES